MDRKQPTLILGTRGSDLALRQAGTARSRLAAAGFDAELRVVETAGDRDRVSPFHAMEGTGFFSAELERALAEGRVDVAVHSCKDLPTTQPEGLTLAAVLARADPADCLVVRSDRLDRRLPLDLASGASVGTSSARRRMQLLAWRPDLDVHELRGNVPTRVGRLREGELDAAVLACAGLDRLALDLDGLVRLRLEPHRFVPAPAQGVVVLECRRGDSRTLDALAAVHHEPTARVVRAERKLLGSMQAGCQSAFGAFAEEEYGVIRLLVASAPDPGSFPRRVTVEHPDAEVLVVEAWRRLHDAMPESVFLSREAEPDGVFRRAMKAYGVDCAAESLVDFEPLDFEWPQRAEWLFFSSRTAVRLFAARLDELPAAVRDLPCGAIGEGTARELRAAGWDARFTADPLDLDASLRAFGEMAAGSTVVFPGAERGRRTAQRALEDRLTADDLPVYRNRPREASTVARPAVAAMTSPMNARAYLARYPDRRSDRFVAIGETTEAALRDAGARRIFRASRPSEMALVEAVCSC